VAFFLILQKLFDMSFNPWLLAIFVVVIFTMLLIDLGLVNKKSHQT
jgi:hypothetical protein